MCEELTYRVTFNVTPVSRTRLGKTVLHRLPIHCYVLRTQCKVYITEFSAIANNNLHRFQLTFLVRERREGENGLRVSGLCQRSATASLPPDERRQILEFTRLRDSTAGVHNQNLYLRSSSLSSLDTVRIVFPLAAKNVKTKKCKIKLYKYIDLRES